MAVLKCKICGGDLEYTPDQTVATCAYCGTGQTLPRLTDDRRANLYDRAGHFRRNNEFDKAAGIYEQLLSEDTTDAEAYWSLVLCRYGIEYVEDPATHRRLPTVNRAQFTSVFDDENYKAALAHADGAQRAIFVADAEAINEIQKGILAISQKEEPFDVFICYKETDRQGRRTHDSVLAQELYFQLKQEGFKVFFARITLEDKLGSAYEPYIFAALHSAKVMVVLGTAAEHFNAVWVKNEWSRYLSLIKNGAPKVLIPAYRDMDPYDLPEEFSHLQAQDMSRLGFMQDLVRGIKKIVGATAPKVVPAPVAVPVAPVAAEGFAVNVNALLRRAALSLEDGDFAKADDFCEQVLNQEPENGLAYFYKLMAELEVNTPAELADCTDQFDESTNYHRALRFGNDKLKAELEGYTTAAIAKRENELLTKAQRAFAAISFSNPKEGLRDARNLMEFLQPLQHCPKGAALLRDCQETEQKLLHEIERQEDEALKWKLDRAMQSINETGNPIHALEDAEGLLKHLKTNAHKPFAAEMIPACEAKIAELERLAEARKKAVREQVALQQRRRRRNIIILCSTVGALVLIGALICFIYNAITYETIDGVTYINNGDHYALYEVDKTISGDIIIPDEIDGKPITAIPNGAFVNKTGITSVTIGKNVTSIGDGAFYYCSNLTTVEFGANSQLTSIGENAFEWCSNLTTITIPASMTSIGEGAFYHCSSLTTVTFGANSQLTSIGEHAFSRCSNLTSVTIPDSVTSIGEYAFYKCTGLTSITLPFVGASLNGTDNTHFGYIFGASSYTDHAGYVPASLKTVVITGGDSIGNYAFYDCDSLSTITIPASVTSIGSGAFYFCSNLTTVEFGANSQLQSIGDFAFGSCSNLTTITIPASMTSIGHYAFIYCSSLASITFEDPSGWYRTSNYSDWNNKTGGTATSLADPATNATYFKSTYWGYYWYKPEE